MIRPMAMRSSISLDTRILDLPANIARLGLQGARKLALGLAEISSGKDINSVTVEDLLLYLPTRYEDRSRMIAINDLQDGLEASLDLTVRLAKARYIGRSRFIFTVSASDQNNTGPQVLIEWFVSGPRAKQIIEYHTNRFVRGTRFIAFGRWQQGKLGFYSLKVSKPDELEVIADNDAEGDPALAAIHVGRCVPVYRKISEIRPKQLREIIHRVLGSLPESVIGENLPADLRRRQKLLARPLALHQIHFPPEDASLEDYETARSPAHRRLIFEELFWLALALAAGENLCAGEYGHRTSIGDDEAETLPEMPAASTQRRQLVRSPELRVPQRITASPDRNASSAPASTGNTRPAAATTRARSVSAGSRSASRT
jgi:ATP-dependent DNA helicase RecG